ncbi:MAG: hypothetical protein EHM67_06930, partial [Hyphomicrobiaceae bacterium]
MSQTSKPTIGNEGGQPTRSKRVEPEPSSRNGNITSRAEQDAAERGREVDAWLRASQIAMIGLFVIALLCCAYLAQPVLVPVLLAWAIATIVLPIVKWLHAHGIPRVLAAILVTVLLCLLIV